MRLKDGLVLSAGLAAVLATISTYANQEIVMTRARGTFEVKLTPQEPDNDPARAAGVQRIAIEKQFQGDLEGTSNAEMLASGDGTTSGAYVALEKFTGKVHDRAGSFVLVHRALMNRGVPEGWTVEIVPDSGTGELQGIRGQLTIRIEGKQHFYELEYSLP